MDWQAISFLVLPFLKGYSVNNTEHISILRRLRNNLSGEEKAALRHMLNRLENFENKLKTINRMSYIKRDHEGRDDEEQQA